MNRLSETFAPLSKKSAGASSPGILLLFMFAHFGHHLVNSLPIPLLPMIRQDFGLDYTQAGFLVASLTVSYGLCQIPAGWLADRWGPRILLTIGISGVAVAGLLVGFVHDYHLLLLCLVAMGVAGGGYHPASPPLISAVVEPQHRGRAMGLHMMAGSAPFFLAPLIAVALAAVWGWRMTFIALALPPMVLGIAFYFLLGKRFDARAVRSVAGDSGHRKEAAFPHPSRRIVPFIVLSTFTHAVTYCVMAFIPLFLIDRFGLSKEAAATFLAIYYSAGLWASLLGGTLSDRLGSVPVVLAVCFLTGPAIYLMDLMPGPFGVACLLFAMGIFNYIRTPVSETYLVTQTSERHRSTILGVYYLSTYEGGGVLTPLMGLLIDRHGFHAGFLTAGAVVFFLSLVCWIFLSTGMRPASDER